MAWKPSTWAKRVRLACIASVASAIAAVAIPAVMTSPVEAKTPGKTYCFVGKCHRVKTIEETHELVGVEQSVTASHYDDCSKDRYNPCGLTSSGERFHPDRPDNTASPIYPDGTQLLVWSPSNKRALVVRVNNAGPYWGNRTLDLSRAAARKLGFEGDGVAKLKVKVIKAPEPEEARYKKNREYDPVPGDIGQYASLDDAQRGMAVVLAFKATTGSPFAPVTTANAFSGQSVGAGNMLVAEAP
ncbi:rare lipoprotein A [Hyphomicrobium sp. 1Nfss2.1]|uniref:septal ring lytic transglycosylase RlpA family protein n=1 Tax=Hyphomicrobium sp. 1Nfss2.1 TaxID=3413936 RepID=UPI003C7BFEE6